MKSTVFATLAGLTLANNTLPNNLLSGSGVSSSTTYYSGQTTASGVLGSGLTASYQGSGVGGSGLGLGLGSGLGTGLGNGVGFDSGLAVSSSGGLSTGAAGLSSGTGLGNIGTGAVLVTANNSGAANIASGQVIVDGNYPRADLVGLSGASSTLVNNNLVASGVINNAFANTSASTRSIDSLFSRLPSSAELDNLILSADSVAILRTIQAVGTNTALPCDQRIAYLLELLGRIKAASAKKSFAGDQLKIVIDASTKEITRLQVLIDGNNAAIGKLGIDALKTKLNGLLADLQAAYVNFNKVQSQIPITEAQIKGSNGEIDFLIKNSDAARNGLANDKLKLADIANQIAAIQTKLRDLQDKQTFIQSAIDKGEAKIADNEKSIAAINIRIDDLQVQIRNLTDDADSFNGKTKDLEVKVGRLRTDISVNEAKKAKILKDNADLTARINIERKKILPDQLAKLNDMLASLRNFLPTVESEIDRHYYYCFGDGKVQVQTNGGVVIYIVRGEAFGNYLRNLYGTSVAVPNNNSGDILFNRVDIFGNNWVGAFGYPFVSDALQGNDFSIGGSFGCLNPNSVVTGSGTITAVGSNYIDCNTSDGNKIRMGLGACSRLESTHQLPAVGQKFYYSGVPQGNNFNLYTGSCFD